MRAFRNVLAVALGAAATAAGARDARLDLRLEHGSYIQFEPVVAFVSIYNDSDLPLVLDAADTNQAGRLSFSVEMKREGPVREIGAKPLVERIRIAPDERREVFTDLSLQYDMAAMGRYEIKARLVWDGRVFESSELNVEIVSGIEILRVTRTVPGAPDRERTYSLRHWNREGDGYLFLSVDEHQSGSNYGVFPLGRIIRLYKPTLEVDRLGRVQVTHQSGANCYTRSVLSSTKDVVRLMDQTYHLPSGDPYPLVDESPKARRPTSR